MAHGGRLEDYTAMRLSRRTNTTTVTRVLIGDRTSRLIRAASRCIVGLIVLAGLLLVGCASESKSDKTVALDEPRAANGVIVETDEPVDLEKMADALDAIDLESWPAIVAPASDPNGEAEENGSAPPKIDVADAVSMTAGKATPAKSTASIVLPKLSKTEIVELSRFLGAHLTAEQGYSVAAAAVGDALPVPPVDAIGDRIVSRPGEGGTHILRFGYRRFVSQPPQLWVLGVIVGADGSLSANPDLALVEPEVTKIIASMNEVRAGLTVRDLEPKLIQLSYTDSKAALSMLKGLGVTTINTPAEIPPKIEFAKLPYVVNIADPDKGYTGLVGKDTKSGKGKLSLTPGVASEMSDNAIASPMTQLMVLFHPAHPEQFSEVRRLLDTFIDRPARQIFIECMVLEISQEGLRDLGVNWALNSNASPLNLQLLGGSSSAGGNEDTLTLGIPDTSLLNEVFEGQFKWDWDVTVRALIRTGKAEILSRPSVLTLNNRQSTIRVGEDIPIASSLQGSYGGKVSFNFEYLPVGILLNIRPRINESGAEVSMLIDTIVSARVPGEDLELKDPGSQVVLASAPRVSTRRVQTYGRIANNTPLIIGGLVAREQTLTKDKIPFLGDLPLIGVAFRSEKRDNMKREVIIVLTPHVLPSKKELRRSLPKDDDLFDSFGNDLFRDSYRIRSEDVFDLTFLLENRRIASYREKARQVAQRDFRLGEQEPFRSFVRDSVPGESILVSRMIYEVIKRLAIADMIQQSRIIYFESQQVGGYDVKFLEALLEGDKKGHMRDFGDKALAISYRYDRHSLEEGRLGSEPVPQIKLIECSTREVWATKLWELNQPTPDGHDRHTILIQNESDVLRLRRALALKRIADLNGGLAQMRLMNFSVGKVLLMPELKQDQIHVMDADTARFFFHTEHYYAASLSEIETQLKQLDKMLHQPEISILLDAPSSEAPAAGQ